MKKFISALFILSASFNLFATINSTKSGFYRVQNYGSSRWATLVDNKGSVDLMSSTADLHALELHKYTEDILSDPASIAYISNITGNNYNVTIQGKTLKSIADNHEIYIGSSGTSGNETLYRIWSTRSNVTKYIADGYNASRGDEGYATIGEVGNKDLQKWIFKQVDVNTDNFFGVKPTIEADGKFYKPLYASFAFKPYSPNVKAFYTGKIGDGIVEMIEITGVVPGGVPVIIECASENVVSNKLELTTTSNKISDNSLSGVYFNYFKNDLENRIKYEPETMRILGTCTDGSLGFITPSDLDYIPANTAYLKVKAGTAPELKCLTPEEFAAGVESIEDDTLGDLKYQGHMVYGPNNMELKVFNLAGALLETSLSGSIDVSYLPKGVYIAVAGKHSLKFVR